MSLFSFKTISWTTLKSKWHDSGTILIFIFLTAFSLWLAGRNYNLLPILISCFITVKYFITAFRKIDNIKITNLFILFYMILIIISAVMHYAALRELNPSTYITVRPNDAEWGIAVNKIAASSYLLFPLFLVVLINIFLKADKSCKLFMIIPVIFIPSLIVAYYQVFFDIHFLNPTITKWLHEITGLSSDFNGFRLSLFVLFPISIFGVIIYRNIWVKVGFVFLSILILFILILSKSRTGLFGIILFVVLLPGISIWAKQSKRHVMKIYLICCVIIFTVMGFSLLYYYQDRETNPVSIKRIKQKYAYFQKYGFKKTLITTFDKNSFIAEKAPSRLEMGYYASILTSLSPTAGWGPGGFLRNIDNIRFQRIHQVQYQHLDNANNHYLQMSADIGIFGALINVILHVWPLWMVFRIRHRITDFRARWIVGISFSIVCIMLILYLTGPHTVNIEVLWVFSCYLAILYVAAFHHGYDFKSVNLKLIALIFVIITFVFAAATYDKTFGQNGYKQYRKSTWWPLGADRNHYDIEQWNEGFVIWCNKDAVIELPIEDSIPENFNLNLLVMHPDVLINPVTVKYGGKSGAAYSMVIRDKSWNTVNIPVTSEYILERSNPKKGFKTTQSLILSFDVSRTWVPKNYGINDDTRELGVAVLIPELSQDAGNKQKQEK